MQIGIFTIRKSGRAVTSDREKDLFIEIITIKKLHKVTDLC